MPRRTDHFLDGTVLNNSPIEDNHHSLADLPYHRKIMADEQRSPARELGIEKVENLLLHDHVECSGRFIADH